MLAPVDAPLGEMREQYRVNINGAGGSIELLADVPNLTIAANDLSPLGSGVATVDVRQIGDLAISPPARLSIAIS